MVTVEAIMPKKMKNWTRIPSFTGRVCMIAGEFIGEQLLQPIQNNTEVNFRDSPSLLKNKKTK
jgi:hypothetical protein